MAPAQAHMPLTGTRGSAQRPLSRTSSAAQQRRTWHQLGGIGWPDHVKIEEVQAQTLSQLVCQSLHEPRRGLGHPAGVPCILLEGGHAVQLLQAAALLHDLAVRGGHGQRGPSGAEGGVPQHIDLQRGQGPHLQQRCAGVAAWGCATGPGTWCTAQLPATDRCEWLAGDCREGCVHSAALERAQANAWQSRLQH